MPQLSCDTKKHEHNSWLGEHCSLLWRVWQLACTGLGRPFVRGKSFVAYKIQSKMSPTSKVANIFDIPCIQSINLIPIWLLRKTQWSVQILLNWNVGWMFLFKVTKTKSQKINVKQKLMGLAQVTSPHPDPMNTPLSLPGKIIVPHAQKNTIVIYSCWHKWFNKP